MRLPILLFLLCTMYIVRGQNIIAPAKHLSDTINGLEFKHFNSLVDIYDLADSATISTIKSKWISDNLGIVNERTKSAVSKSNLEINSFYSSGVSASYFGNGFFSNLRIEQHVTIVGQPMVVQGDLVVQDNSVNRRLSTLNISFDQEALLGKYREKVKKQALKKSFFNLSNEQQQLIQEYLTVDSYRQILLNEAHHLRKNALIHTIDSLRGNMRGSVKGSAAKDTLQSISLRKIKESILTDSMLIDSLHKLQADMNNTERRVDSLYNVSLQKWKEIQQALQKWQENISKYQRLADEKIENGFFEGILDGQEKGNKLNAILMGLRRFNVGSFRMRGSSFDIASIPLNGFNMEISRRGYYASIGYGKEGKQQRQFPDYVRNLRFLGESRTVLQARGGIGMPEKSHLHILFNAMNLPGSTDSAYLSFPKQNVVLSVDSRYMVSERVFIELTGSASKADFTGSSSTKELLSGLYNAEGHGRNMAGLIQVGWKDKKGKSEYLIGYQMVGDNFVTLGNPFLINNRRSIRLEGKQRFGNNRGQMKASYMKGTTNNTADITPGIQQNRFSGELSYRLTKRGSRIWGTYSPSFYLQNAPGSASALYQLNLATIGTQWMFARGKKGQWITMAQVTNYSDQSQFGDTSTVTGLWYGMLTQTYSSDRYLITVLANLGIDAKDLRTVRDVNVDANQSFIHKTMQISQGFQLVRRFYGSGFLVGGSGGIQIRIKNALRASLGGTYLIGISNGEKNQFYMNFNTSWQF